MKNPRARKAPVRAENGKKPSAAESLENSLSLLRATLESTADGILVINREGNVETMNRRFVEMWRFSARAAKSISDQSLLDTILPQLKDPEGFLAKVRELYARPSAESFDLIEFRDGRVMERYSRPQRLNRKIIGRVWSFRDITGQARAQTVQSAVYRISEIANMAGTLEELFRALHGIIGELMPAGNFYIALFDPASLRLSFPYFVDEFDEPPSSKPLGRGLTEYVLRTGEPLLADPKKFMDLQRTGEVESIGAPSIDWLGVPLKIMDRTIGIMVVQTYAEGVRYREEDRDILMFVSTQAAVAIERKKAEEALKASLREKEILLREIHHRVKNNMQVISSLLSFHSGRIEDPAAVEMIKDSQQRIRSMALVHEKLYQSKDMSRIDFASYIQSLTMRLFHFLQTDPDRVRIVTELDDISLDINIAVPLGLIINEVVSNAFKHAFPGERAGEIRIALRAEGEGRLVLTVSDNGVGIPEGLDLRNANTLGMQIVSMLVDQIEGTIQFDGGPGTSVRIIFREFGYKRRG
jgi:two-component sensor histidine kinase